MGHLVILSNRPSKPMVDSKVSFPAMVEYFKGFFPGWSYVLPCTQFWEGQEQSGAPLEKCLQSHEGHEMPTDQPGLRWTKNKKKVFCHCKSQKMSNDLFSCSW